MAGPERCFASRQNREAGSRKFPSDGEEIIRDDIFKSGEENIPDDKKAADWTLLPMPSLPLGEFGQHLVEDLLAEIRPVGFQKE